MNSQMGNRNSPVAYNRILSGPQFWDGRANSLEDQAIGPIANPIEMGNTHEVAVKVIAKIPGYGKQFDAIFEDGLSIENIGKAIASFERTLSRVPRRGTTTKSCRISKRPMKPTSKTWTF